MEFRGVCEQQVAAVRDAGAAASKQLGSELNGVIAGELAAMSADFAALVDERKEKVHELLQQVRSVLAFLNNDAADEDAAAELA